MKKIKIALVLFPVLSAIALSIFYESKRILPRKLEPVESAVVEAVPKQLVPGSEMIFTLYLKNHPTDPDYNHTNMALVVDGEGKIYKPINWTGESGKTQVTGDLIFDKLDKGASRVGLNIKGVDNKNVVFDWEL